ncbi:MAG TPA: hypothetical protein VK489_10070 [Ferruginibacter sp.]|nr:hypothetical protein [Ferruginibacter sp.]
MRYSLILATVILVFAACKKDKFTTAPQISYKSVDPNVVRLNLPFQQMPILTIKITDAEGDLGLTDTDTARIYIKNLITGKTDSTMKFPDLSGVGKGNFEADVEIKIDGNILLEGTTRPTPKTDTLYYEIYIKDFGKNKSNVIKTNDPVFIIRP